MFIGKEKPKIFYFFGENVSKYTSKNISKQHH